MIKCINDGCFAPVENKDTGECASCARARRKLETTLKQYYKSKTTRQNINKISKKLSAKLDLYHAKKAVWIKGKKCAVYPFLPAKDIHHMKGRIGELLLDEKYWLPVSREGHIKIEQNPKWAVEQGFSMLRLAKDL